MSTHPPTAATSLGLRCFRVVAHARRNGCHAPPRSGSRPASFSARRSHPVASWIVTEGAVWYADVPNKRCVRVRERDVLQTVDLDLGCFPCMLGGADRRTLFMVVREWLGLESTADRARTGQVLTVRAPVPGAGSP